MPDAVSSPPVLPRSAVVLSRLLSAACIAVMAFTVIAVLVAAFAPFGTMLAEMSEGHFDNFSYSFGTGAPALAAPPDSYPASDLGAAWRLIVFAWAAASSIFLIWGLNGARRCFDGIAAGRYFEAATVRGLRTLALGVLIYMVIEPVMKIVFGPFITHALTGKAVAELSIQLTGNGMLILIFAGAVAVVANALTRAAAIAEENEQFV